MNSIYLHKEDLEQLVKFMDSFGHDIVEITSDNSSGIGSIIDAHLHGVTINGQIVTVKKNLADESSW